MGDNVTYVDSSSDVIRYQLDSSDIIELIEHYLKGEVWDHSKEQYIKKFEPIVNENGFNSIMNFLVSRVNRIFSTTNIDEKEIYMMIRTLRFDLIDLLEMNWKNFGLKKSNLSPLLNMITDAVFVTLKKSQNGTFMKLLQTTIKKEEIKTESSQSQSSPRSIFNLFGGGIK